MQVGREVQHLIRNPLPEQVLSDRDPILAKVIVAQPACWPAQPIEDPIWGLTRIVMAQQVSTHVACNIAERVKSSFPTIASPERALTPSVAELRAFGIPERRARSCVDILTRADEILGKVAEGVLLGACFSRNQRNRPLDDFNIQGNGPSRSRCPSFGRCRSRTRG